MDTRPRAPGAVRWIVRTLEDAGYPTWAVGGAVRDALLGREGGDWDLATRARPREVRRLFPRTVPIGIEHGTVGVLDRSGVLFEVTTFRRDVETLGRHAVVEFADSIDEDLARRDFTINALAWHPLREELHDPFGGLDDLDRRILRTVGRPGERFAEDYLRVLRALRFAGQFSLTVEEETWRALCRAVGGLAHLSAERVREELMKVLGDEEPPSRALGLYAASGALAQFAPELEAIVAPRGEDGQVGEHWIRAVLTADVVRPERPLLRLAALLRWTGGLSRVAGRDDGSLEPEERAGRRAAALMTRLRFSNAETDRVTALVRAGPEPPDPEEGGGALRRWLARNGPKRLPDLARLWVADARVERRRGRPRAAERAVAAWRALRAQLAAEPPLTEGDLALDGRDLIRMGLEPGPRFGEILEGLLERVLEDPGLNRRETLVRIVEEEVEDER
ncbi:MAG: hypothetical protein GWM92_05430 [Gemmatimonadetes bacterium]|nr:hypothetical protein [Gemmatimonadota bacterium]NIR79267.1 hypothetical protein [Gemmatimonadota bacterium]NIT86586.1 hypothetical protein [Gemmatimonadota bacterium]NIU30436.1 hypothetical protein [Gemmatimonadota bacterium]NIU36397.1 hypothetical protein [Gemmatimonadota bacterium]